MNGTSLDTVLQVGKWILNTIFHQCVAVIAIYAIWIPIDHFSGLFSWHVILCTLGLVPLMAEAFIIFSGDNVWTQEIQREKKFLIHGGLMFLGIFLIITGISLEIHWTTNLGLTHFTSPHSIIGLITMLFLIFALVCGPLVLLKITPRLWIQLAHNILGQLGYSFGIVCLCLGFYTDWFVAYTSEISRNSATTVIVIVAAWSLINAWKSTFHQIKAVRN